jgi:lysophospholipase L1-like esterase
MARMPTEPRIWHRYVAIGDSFTEGVGDPDPDRPNGLRGWADRVAEVLAGTTDDFEYANLAIRGRKLRTIIEEQVPPALALAPDLVTSYAGANDILRPRVDLDDLAAAYDEAVGRLVATGATVVLFTAFDPGGSAIYRPMRGRFALYTEAVREIADRHSTRLVDFWRMRDYRDFGYWDTDRMHLGPAGHQRMAMAVLEALGVPHRLEALPPTELPDLTGRELRAKNVEWARTHAAPWVHRRLTGRSSGDSISPKRPGLGPI